MSKRLQEALINAAILAGLGFFFSLASVGISGIRADPLTAIYQASIVAGLWFFTRLALERGLKYPPGS